MTTWLTSDLHLGHANCVKWRPEFNDVDHMNRELIARYNDQVADEDTVWILGDLAMGKIDDTLRLVAQLKGVKTLICGNHDRPWAGRDGSNLSRRDRETDWVARYKNEGGLFEVLPAALPVDRPLNVADLPSLSLSDDRGARISAAMWHFPSEGDHTADERYLEWRPKDQGRWLLHGHVHEEWKVRGRQINVGVDRWDYTPVSESALVGLILDNQ